jgi:hypothetical protein
MAKTKKLKTYSIKDRKNLVHMKAFATLAAPDGSFKDFFESLPNVYAAAAFKKLARAIIRARERRAEVVVGMGAHVVKCGLNPILIDLMERGFVTAVATHGASAIHDYEIALIGATSEDVARGLRKGIFGMARETAKAIAGAARAGAKTGVGLGRALGEMIQEGTLPHKDVSIFAAGCRLDIPCLVHVALGTDIVHMHPEVKGEDLGKSSMMDFKKFCTRVENLEGGVYLNIGSAVIMPEVFLKAASVAYNLGLKLEGLVTANLDMIQHYRQSVNVLARPAHTGIAITGHHEINLPLLRMALLAYSGA